MFKYSLVYKVIPTCCGQPPLILIIAVMINQGWPSLLALTLFLAKNHNLINSDTFLMSFMKKCSYFVLKCS